MLRVLAAFAAGVLLYQVAVVLVGGILAAVAVPQTYFAWFGRPNLELALAMLQLVKFSVPIALLVAGGTLSVQYLLGMGERRVLLAVLAGLVACYMFWLSTGVLLPPPDLPEEPFSASVLLKQVLLPPWWALSGALAPWLGFALAAWLTLRKSAR